MKYYDIEYQGTTRSGEKSQWRDVINKDPETFIKDLLKHEKKAQGYYIEFNLLIQREISKQGYEDFKGYF